MGKSKRSINPADALRKAQRKRELKKNKEIRKSAREAGLAKKDTDKIRIDIGRLEGLERSGAIDKTGQTRLTQLKDELAQIEKAKKEVNKPLSKAQEALAARQQQQSHDSRKLVFDPKSGKFVPVKRKESTKKTTGDDKDDDEHDSEESSSDESSMSEDEDTGIIGMTVEENEEEEEEEEEGNDEQVEEDEIPMPEGPPPVVDSDDEIDIPLPPGPPPPQPFSNQLSAIKNQYGPFVPKTPPPPPAGPPPILRYTTMRPPPPPPPPRYSFMRPPPPPPRPPFGYTAYMQQPSYHAPPRPAAPTPQAPPPIISTETSKTATISAEPQLRDLQKELVGFVPAALRRKQAQARKSESLPKGARPNDINLAPDVE